MFANGVWELCIAELIGSFLNFSNAVVINVGINIRATPIPLAKKFVTTPIFYLFQPHLIASKYRMKNISYFKIKNINVFI